MAIRKLNVVSPAEYRILADPPPRIRTPRELFDYQVENLVEKGIATYAAADPFLSKLPRSGLVLWVPRVFSMREAVDLIKHVVLDGDHGFCHIYSRYFRDLVEMPDSPHLLVDVEDGRYLLGKSLAEVGSRMQEEGRHPFTLTHAILHAIAFPWVLHHHRLAAIGTRCKETQVAGLTKATLGPELTGTSGNIPKARDRGEYSLSPQSNKSGWGYPSYIGCIV